MTALRLVLLLVILSAMYAVGLSIWAYHGFTAPPEATALLWSLEVQTLLAIWVRMDRRHRKLILPFEFEAFVFFGWPICLPYYLWRTRGRRGVAITAAVYALFLAPRFIAAIVGVGRRLGSW